jgi:thymidylate synthase
MVVAADNRVVILLKAGFAMQSSACFKRNPIFLSAATSYEVWDIFRCTPELEWYKTQSLNVNDIPKGAPKMWKMCATKDGRINSNYGWCILSEENCYQFEHCLNMLTNDIHTREACMIYNRPSMQKEYNKDNMHDFMCTFAVQCFLNEDVDGTLLLDYQVFQRSCDAVFGYCNDYLWHAKVQEELANALCDTLDRAVYPNNIIYNCGSLHVYERHFKYFDNI